MPYLSFPAINYDIPVISEVITWFESCIIRSYANPVVEHQILLAKDAPYKEQFIRALNDMDIDITGYRYDEDTKQLFMQRTLSSQEYELPFSQESDGTKKLIAALPVILLALREGRMVIIDELDAKLHPKLLRYVISLFKNKEINKYGAQLLFTSHDMYTLKIPYSAVTRSGLPRRMLPTKAKSIRCMKSVGKITTASKIPRPTISSIWKDAMELIHTFPTCSEVISHEFKTSKEKRP